MKLGTYELNRTYCGDNAKLIQGLPDGCIDLTVTSPPYDDMDLDFNPISKKGLRTYDGYTWNFKTLARELYRVTKPGGVVVWVVNDPTIDGSESLASSLQKIYFRRVGWWIYDTMIFMRYGGIPTEGRYSEVFEYMFILSKGKPKTLNFIKDKPNSKAGKREKKTKVINKGKPTPGNGYYVIADYGRRTNIWDIPTGKNGDDQTGHPAPFPEALARDHITSWSNPGDIVLDPFMGSGTAAKMAIETGRNFIGFEISEKYVALCNRRTAGAKVPLFDWTSV